MEVVKFLITRKVNVNLTEPIKGRTALHWSAGIGIAPIIELLISKGAKHDVRDKIGSTPLHHAAVSGHNEAVACLLEHEAQIDALDDNGLTPLNMAASLNRL